MTSVWYLLIAHPPAMWSPPAPGLDVMVRRLLSEMTLMSLDADEDVAYNSTRETFMYWVGTKDLYEGLQAGAQLFVDYSIARYDQVTLLHTVRDVHDFIRKPKRDVILGRAVGHACEGTLLHTVRAAALLHTTTYGGGGGGGHSQTLLHTVREGSGVDHTTCGMECNATSHAAGGRGGAARRSGCTWTQGQGHPRLLVVAANCVYGSWPLSFAPSQQPVCLSLAPLGATAC